MKNFKDEWGKRLDALIRAGVCPSCQVSTVILERRLDTRAYEYRCKCGWALELGERVKQERSLEGVFSDAVYNLLYDAGLVDDEKLKEANAVGGWQPL